VLGDQIYSNYNQVKAYFLSIALFVFGCISPVHAAEPLIPVELYSHGRKLELSELDQSKLIEQALQLLKTSNFHSGKGDKNNLFTLHDVQNDYRATVAGRFLVCRFKPSNKVTTIGGGILVSEIVIGLNRDDYASSLFTVDEDGSVVGHAKYSGELCIKILQAIQSLKK
jgi:hypothetical protein